MTLLTAGEHRAIDPQYERMTGQPHRYERVYWWPTREWVAYTVEVSLGRQDSVRADPDAAMTPDASLFGSAERREMRAWLAEHNHQRSVDIETRIYGYLERRGPCTVGAVRSALGLSQTGVRRVLLRRDDLFVIVGEGRNKRNNIVPLWDIRREAA